MIPKLFDKAWFAELDQKAQQSPRKRSNVNVHNHYDDPVQRLFITLYPNSYVRPHRHSQTDKWEFFLMISGEVDFLLFDDQGVCIERIRLSAQGECRGLEIPPNVWHAVVPCEQAATFFEVKNGPYQVLDDKDFAYWAPAEHEPGAAEFVMALSKVKVGEMVEVSS